VPTIPLELLVDATGVQRGAAEAARGLDSIIGKSQQTEQSLSGVSRVTSTTGASMDEAFGAAKGGLKLTQGLAQVQVGVLGVASGTKDLHGVLQTAGNALVNFGNLGSIWRNMSTAMTQVRTTTRELVRDNSGLMSSYQDITRTQNVAVTGMRGLWITIQQNPIAALSVGLGLAAAAMSLFSSKTKEASAAYEDLLKQSGRLNAEQMASARFGVNIEQGARFQNLWDLAVRATGEKGAMPSLVDVMRMFGGGYAGAADPSQAVRQYATTRDLARDLLGGEWPATAPAAPMQREQFFALLQAYAQRHGTSERDAGRFGVAAPSNPPFLSGTEPSMFLPQYGPLMSEDQRWGLYHENARRRQQEEQERQAEAERASMDRMREMARLSQQIGGYLGDAAADFALGLRSAKQLLAGLLADLARMGFRTAATQLTQTFLNSFGGGAGAGGGSGSNINLPGPEP